MLTPLKGESLEVDSFTIQSQAYLTPHQRGVKSHLLLSEGSQDGLTLILKDQLYRHGYFIPGFLIHHLYQSKWQESTRLKDAEMYHIYVLNLNHQAHM